MANRWTFRTGLWYFESQGSGESCPYEKRSPLSCRVIATQVVTASGHSKFTLPPPSTSSTSHTFVLRGTWYFLVIGSYFLGGDVVLTWQSHPHYGAGMLMRLYKPRFRYCGTVQLQHDGANVRTARASANVAQDEASEHVISCSRQIQ